MLTLVLAAGLAITNPVPAGPLHTVYVVRHAEKQAGVPDPALDPRGTRRATALERRLAALPVSSVWSSDTRRTRSTAEPTARRRSIEVRPYPLQGGVSQAMQDLAARLRNGEGGSHPLVVGHSNTVPDLLGALGVRSPPTLSEKEYGDLFVVLDAGTGRARALRLRFGDEEASESGTDGVRAVNRSN